MLYVAILAALAAVLMFELRIAGIEEALVGLHARVLALEAERVPSSTIAEAKLLIAPGARQASASR